MTTYRYIARTGKGERVKGEIEAANTPQVIELLAHQQLSPIRVSEAKADATPKLSFKDAGRLSSEIARLTAAGVPLEAGTALASQAQESRAARHALELAAKRLAQGQGPGEAFAGLEGAPGRALSAVVAAGERSGRLADALKAAAPLFTATARFREKIISLMLYPSVVSITALGVLVVFLLVVIPSLRPVFESLGEAMPASARWMLAVSDAAPSVLVAMLIAVLAAILLGQIPALRAHMARWRDQVALGPLGMGLAEAIDIALFARLFAALLKAGTPAGDAMAEASAATSNTILKDRLLVSAHSVRQGGSLDVALSEALGERHLIVQASRLGMRGGSFADLVAEAGLTLAERAETRLERIASLAGPLIIILLGFVIGLMVVTLFSSLTALPDAAAL
tara:strand:- start:245316 stop:246503 length:1188 start_codon:yes stop_codon:yes gene_type:complete